MNPSTDGVAGETQIKKYSVQNPKFQLDERLRETPTASQVCVVDLMSDDPSTISPNSPSLMFSLRGDIGVTISNAGIYMRRLLVSRTTYLVVGLL